MEKTVISCRNLGKKYRLGEQSDVFTGAEFIMNKLRSCLHTEKIQKTESREFWAMRNISFDVSQGEILGIIGRNGSGKSTLLKILGRITHPTEGEFGFSGRMACLLEVGTGFKQELTGYDNIFLSGTTLGLNRREITQQLDEIIEFAEIEEFIHTPIKRYSSGMRVRLAFAVAAHLKPDIMLLDEVLAVGDQKFQKKSLKKMSSVAQSGHTVLFVSHDMQAVTQLCSKVIYLEKGQVIGAGEPAEMAKLYVDRNRELTQDSNKYVFSRDHTKSAQILKIKLGKKQDQMHFDLSENIDIEINCVCDKTFEDLHLIMSVLTLDGQQVFVSREMDGQNFSGANILHIQRDAGYFTIKGCIQAPCLNTGFYELNFYLCSHNAVFHDEIKEVQIEIHDHHNNWSSMVTNKRSGGNILKPVSWNSDYS
jgi:lipopolysaccharide transport system ATP-binding protein